MEQTSFVWSEYEYEYRKKSSDWYFVLGILSLASAAVAFIFNNILFGIAILAGAFALALHGAKRPAHIEFTVDERGIVIGTTRYPFSSLESFGVTEERISGRPILIVKSKKLLMPYLIIPIGDTDAAKLEQFLGGNLKKEELEEPFPHRLAEFFGL